MGISFSAFTSILAAMMRMATPLGLAAIGGTLSEKSGIIALGLEGYMTIGAFFAVVGCHYFDSTWMGLLFAAISGGLFATVFALMCIRYEANQTVCGLGMSTIAPGLVAILMVTLFGNKGKSAIVGSLPAVRLPVISEIPGLGYVLSGHTILFYLMIIVAIAAWFVMNKTPFGLRLRSAGTNPEVIDALGLSSKRIRYIAVITSGILAGLGGAYLSIGQLNFYSQNMVAGRGYIAIAVFVFANWNPVSCIFTALLFAFAEAIQMRLQVVGIPSSIVQMLPYVCTLLALLYSKKHTCKNKSLLSKLLLKLGGAQHGS